MGKGGKGGCIAVVKWDHPQFMSCNSFHKLNTDINGNIWSENIEINTKSQKELGYFWDKWKWVKVWNWWTGFRDTIAESHLKRCNWISQYVLLTVITSDNSSSFYLRSSQFGLNNVGNPTDIKIHWIQFFFTRVWKKNFKLLKILHIFVWVLSDER